MVAHVAARRDSEWRRVACGKYLDKPQLGCVVEEERTHEHVICTACEESALSLV